MALAERLTIRLTVPMTERVHPATGPMIFHRWLPIGRDKGLQLTRGGYTVTVWFDVRCAVWAADLNEEDIGRHPALYVHRFYVDVETTVVEHDLLEYMKSRDFSRVPTPEEMDLANRYETLGRAVFESVFHALNRLMDYMRIEKGQFWLVQYEKKDNPVVEFNAKAQIDGGDWFRWNPSQIIRLNAVIPDTDSPRYIMPEVWDRARVYLQSDARPDLARQLLADAELLAESGHDRAALTEAVSALEVAVFRFARSEKCPQAVRSVPLDSVQVDSLKTLVDHLGLTATVQYVLPLIFSDEDLPSSLLAECRSAIAQRQNVIHNGQRQVDGLRSTERLEGHSKCLRSATEGGRVIPIGKQSLHGRNSQSVEMAAGQLPGSSPARLERLRTNLGSGALSRDIGSLT